MKKKGIVSKCCHSQPDNNAVAVLAARQKTVSAFRQAEAGQKLRLYELKAGIGLGEQNFRLYELVTGVMAGFDEK